MILFITNFNWTSFRNMNKMMRVKCSHTKLFPTVLETHIPQVHWIVLYFRWQFHVSCFLFLFRSCIFFTTERNTLLNSWQIFFDKKNYRDNICVIVNNSSALEDFCIPFRNTINIKYASERMAKENDGQKLRVSYEKGNKHIYISIFFSSFALLLK